MIANIILHILDTIIGTILIPIQLVSTLLLGILVSITFGLLIYPIALVWLILSLLLISLSWLSSILPGGRFIVGMIGLPLALISSIYVQLMPSMGELESRASHMMLCEAWPYSFEYWQFASGRESLADYKSSYFLKALMRSVGEDPLKKQVIKRFVNRESLDPNL